MFFSFSDNKKQNKEIEKQGDQIESVEANPLGGLGSWEIHPQPWVTQMPKENSWVEAFANGKDEREKKERAKGFVIFCEKGPQHSCNRIVEVSDGGKKQKNQITHRLREAAKLCGGVSDPVKADQVENKLRKPATDKKSFWIGFLLKEKQPQGGQAKCQGPWVKWNICCTDKKSC
jgi:hypothetical protein